MLSLPATLQLANWSRSRGGVCGAQDSFLAAFSSTSPLTNEMQRSDRALQPLHKQVLLHLKLVAEELDYLSHSSGREEEWVGDEFQAPFSVLGGGGDSAVRRFRDLK